MQVLHSHRRPVAAVLDGAALQAHRGRREPIQNGGMRGEYFSRTVRKYNRSQENDEASLFGFVLTETR